MTFELPVVHNYEALLLALRRTDLKVLPRTKGRTTEQTEIWTICRLLSPLAEADRLAFPLTVTHRDRPDFLIHTGNAAIGVEVTEAVSQQFAEFSALAEREYPDALLELAHFRWDAPQRTPAEMRVLLAQPNLTSDGWVGDGPEREWAMFIHSAVEAKLKKLDAPEFDKFDRNWLAIYDNLPLPIDLNFELAVAHLRPKFERYWRRSPSFDALYVEHDRAIMEITAQSMVRLALNDLWR